MFSGVASHPHHKSGKKAPEPTLIYVGRINADKRVHHLIEALSEVRKHVPSARLWIVGKGEPAYVEFLEKEIHRFGIAAAVRFFGYVSEEKKMELLAQAWLVVSASIMEGWGLIVIEGNAVGTPAVVYNIPGYRDSVRDGETGILTRTNTPQALATCVVRVLQNKHLYAKLREQAVPWSSHFDWQRTADELLSAAMANS